MNKNDKDLEKFKRVKAIIDGTAKPFIPSSKSGKSTKSVGGKKSTSGSSAMKKSNFKKSTTTTKKSKKQVESESESDEDLDNNYGINDEDDDNQGESLNKLPNKFEDEEIEEEDAFDDDDDDLTKSSKNKNYDAEFEGEDYIDLDELLDDDNSSVSTNTNVSKEDEQEEKEEVEQEDSDDDNSDSSLFSENEFSEPEEEQDNQQDQDTDNSNLMSIVKGLDKSKRTIRSTSKLPDMTEKVGLESQYNLFPNADENGTIDINDLMSFIPNEFGDIVDQLGAISNKAPISAPVSKYERDTIQRRITTEQAHRILTQWVPFVREQREKNLKFESKVTIDNTAQSVASSFGKTSLNKEISSVLLESGVTESKQKPSSTNANATIKNIITSEDGKTVAIVDPVEEKRRLREIIKLRSIMYYQEIKDKRKKKIKSKKFRKIEKKKREKDLEKREEELMKLDPEFAKHKAEKLEEKRVLERMTQRHKNNSKFMKNMLNNRSGLSTDDRRDINEHNKLGKELLLLNKMNNSTVNQDDSDDESGSDDDDDNQDDETTNTGKIDLTDVDQKSLSDKERIQMKLQKLGRSTNLPEKGINAMKFMQKSMEKELDDAIKERNGIDDFEQAELDDAERESQDSNRIILHKQVGSNKQSSNKIMNSGILVEKAGFGNGHKVVSNLIQVGDNKSTTTTPTPKTSRVEFEEEELDEDNPWLEATKSKKKSKKDKKKQFDEFLISLNNLNSGNKINNNNNNNAKEKVNNNEISNIDTTTTNKKQTNQRKFENKGPSIAGVDTNTGTEEKKSKKQFVGMSLITSNKQKDLLLEAFAKDNIEDEFIDEKKQIIQDEVPEEKSNFLPGWGGWVGDGVVQKDNSKREALLKRKREEKIKEQQKKRLDAHNNRVIIDEKAPLESVSKYVLNKLPQHYSNKDQYESTLSIAHGKDWNSTTAFRKLIEPKVSVSPGTFIKPVSIKDKQDFITKKKEESKKQKRI